MLSCTRRFEMEFEDKVTAVGRMQAYIATHLDEDISLEALTKVVGYSKYHAARIFKELTGQTPFETAPDEGGASVAGFRRKSAQRSAG